MYTRCETPIIWHRATMRNVLDYPLLFGVPYVLRIRTVELYQIKQSICSMSSPKVYNACFCCFQAKMCVSVKMEGSTIWDIRAVAVHKVLGDHSVRTTSESALVSSVLVMHIKVSTHLICMICITCYAVRVRAMLKLQFILYHIIVYCHAIITLIIQFPSLTLNRVWLPQWWILEQQSLPLCTGLWGPVLWTICWRRWVLSRSPCVWGFGRAFMCACVCLHGWTWVLGVEWMCVCMCLWHAYVCINQ